MDKESLILLNAIGVGKRSLEKFSKAELSRKLAKARQELDLEEELSLIKRHGVNIVTILDPAYPKMLKEIHSPPIVLYVKGNVTKDDEFAVAIVGSRFASMYGISTSQRLGYELASRGVVVTSGLARGIDTAAHQGALKAYGKTIAVLGNGLNTVYPPENEELADEIVKKGGAVISEFPMGSPPVGKNFPKRNRVISGLSLGVVVVEAAKNSGALITADFALEQDREVFAVPGEVNSATSFGTNALIKQGAKLIQTADDVLDELGLKLEGRPADDNDDTRAVLKPRLSGEEKVVYESLSKAPKYLDEIVEGTKLPLGKTMSLLLALEIKKLVKELPGKNFVKA